MTFRPGVPAHLAIETPRVELAVGQAEIDKWMGRLQLPWFDTHKEKLTELLPRLGPQDAALTHRADYDARYQATILTELLNMDPPLPS